jgi:hypothetical protein
LILSESASCYLIAAICYPFHCSVGGGIDFGGMGGIGGIGGIAGAGNDTDVRRREIFP